MSAPISRRRLLGLTGAGVLAGAAGGVGSLSAGQALAAGGRDEGSIPFHGPHQAGIATPVQDRLHFAAFDVTTRSRDRLVRLLREWTRAAEAMTAGRPVGDGAVGGRPLAPPDDTGEALGLPPARLTLTIGFGPTMFERDGVDRFGLRGSRPAALVDLPHFPGDNIDPARSHGDIAVQACADDPQVAVHAIRDLARIGFGVVSMRWSELGFGKTSSTTPSQQTPRNLFGFKDGTNNIASDDEAALRRHVWVREGDGPSWMTGGSYLVVRRVRMHIETWDRTSLGEQQRITGRRKGSGAPFGGESEHDHVVLPRLPPRSHVRLANPGSNGGIRILRRGYSFVDGSDDLGRLKAGLFFIVFDRDPRRQFVPLQRKLTEKGTMNEYIEYVAQGIWACPPGLGEGGFWGEGLLA